MKGDSKRAAARSAQRRPLKSRCRGRRSRRSSSGSPRRAGCASAAV